MNPDLEKGGQTWSANFTSALGLLTAFLLFILECLSDSASDLRAVIYVSGPPKTVPLELGDADNRQITRKCTGRRILDVRRH